jgi:hypothetical protein
MPQARYHGQTPQGYIVVNTNSWTGGACVASDDGEPAFFAKLGLAEAACRLSSARGQQP